MRAANRGLKVREEELLPPRAAWTTLKQEAGEGDCEETSPRCAAGSWERTGK